MLNMIDKMEKEVEYQKKQQSKVVKENKQLRAELQQFQDQIDGDNAPEILRSKVSDLSNKLSEKTRQNQELKSLVK